MSDGFGGGRIPRGARAALEPLLGSSRAVVAALTDLRAVRRHTDQISDNTAEIRENTAALKQLAEHLAAIDDNVAALNGEVRQMRATVESIGEEVGSLKQAVEPVETLIDMVPGGRRRARRAAARAEGAEDA